MAKTVLITGAATGFGRGVALGLARKGWTVIAGCQICPQVWDLREAAKTEGLAMQVVKLDVLDPIDIECIAPQHGGILRGKEDVKTALAYLRGIGDVGIEYYASENLL